jgi:hypothetical protein
VRDWLRVNMATTIDGAAWGADGLTGSINNTVDKRVFHLLRRCRCDHRRRGHRTAGDLRPSEEPLVVLSNSGRAPAIPGSLLVVPATTGLSGEGVQVLGSDTVDLTKLRHALAAFG